MKNISKSHKYWFFIVIPLLVALGVTTLLLVPGHNIVKDAVAFFRSNKVLSVIAICLIILLIIAVYHWRFVGIWSWRWKNFVCITLFLIALFLLMYRSKVYLSGVERARLQTTYQLRIDRLTDNVNLLSKQNSDLQSDGTRDSAAYIQNYILKRENDSLRKVLAVNQTPIVIKDSFSARIQQPTPLAPEKVSLEDKVQTRCVGKKDTRPLRRKKIFKATPWKY